MKKVLLPHLFISLLAPFLFLSSFFCQAQSIRKHDVIIKRDSIKIEVFIQQVDESTVKYKKRSDPDGPVFSVAKTEIATIIYGNGEVENISAPNEQYFGETNVPPVVSYQKTEAPEQVYTGAQGIIRGRTTQQLQSNYRLYLKKAASYKTMGIVGISAGTLLTVIGIVTISSAADTYNSNTYGSSTTNYDAKLAGGVLLAMAGLGAGIPLTIIGLVKKNSYNKKALLVRDELRRRNELSFRPGYNVASRAGYLSLRMTF